MVGRLNVRDIYPPGQARDVMRRLRGRRSAAADEVSGRLRCEVVTKSGEVVPVASPRRWSPRAGEETATVGVFRDLREELRGEAELLTTRERLEAAEKAALVCRAGRRRGARAQPAAHQRPRLLGAALPQDPGTDEVADGAGGDPSRGRADGGIVQKIGKITRYETTPYVGKTRIVDLDRASKPRWW